MRRLARPYPLLLALHLTTAGCSPPPSAVRAWSLLERGDYGSAKREIAQACSRDPDDSTVIASQMRLQLVQQRPQLAVDLYLSRMHDGRGKSLLRELAQSTIWAALRHPDPATRVAAIHATRSADVDAVYQEMQRRLTDPDPLVRVWAAVALSATPAAADQLEQMLSASRASARSVAIAQLGRLARAAAIPTIEEHLGDPSPEVRAACARAIAYSASAEGLAPLRKLAADAHPTVRHAAVLAIAALRLPEAHALLERALRDKDSAVRKAALTAVAALNDLNSLRSATRDADLSVALHAGQLLAKQGEVQPVLNAIAMALVDPLWTLRATALNTASSVNDRVAWRLGTKGLRDPQPEVRLAAARMLQTHHLRPKAVSRAIASLVAQFCDGRHQLPEQCIQATELLLREDADVGSKRLHRLAVSRIRWQYRRAAYYLLFARETRPASAGVLDALSDSEPRVALLAAVHVLRHL